MSAWMGETTSDTTRGASEDTDDGGPFSGLDSSMVNKREGMLVETTTTILSK